MRVLVVGLESGCPGDRSGAFVDILRACLARWTCASDLRLSGAWPLSSVWPKLSPGLDRCCIAVELGIAATLKTCPSPGSLTVPRRGALLPMRLTLARVGYLIGWLRPPKLLVPPRCGRRDLLDFALTVGSSGGGGRYTVGILDAWASGWRRTLGHALARFAGWPVISGLAEGIDAAVHGGCLQADGAAWWPCSGTGHRISVYPRRSSMALQKAVAQHRAADLGTLLRDDARVQRGHVRPSEIDLTRGPVASALVVIVECPGARAVRCISARQWLSRCARARFGWCQGMPCAHSAQGKQRSAAEPGRHRCSRLISGLSSSGISGPGPFAPA